MNTKAKFSVQILCVFITLSVIFIGIKADWTKKEGKHRNHQQYAIARLSKGLIRGRVSYAAGPRRPAHVFEGIPFAEPPLGPLRWKHLKEKRPWKGVVNATKYAPACLSNTTDTSSPQLYISEDCIYANVFADPKCKYRKGGCPILYYIHGGGFRFDSATMFNETQIVQKYASDGVIFVIPAFRLGVFGLLDLQDEAVVNKNLALYDVLYGLRWTKREVPKAFGGDPDRITIMGNSGGSVASAFLLTSPLVQKGDFQQAFLSSGGLEIYDSPNAKPSAMIAHHFNCTSRNFSPKRTLNCLRQIPALDLLRHQQMMEVMDGDKMRFNGVSTDGKLVPGQNSVAALEYWKKDIKLVVTSTLTETEPWICRKTRGCGDSSPKGIAGEKRDACTEGMVMFNLKSQDAFNTCEERMKDNPSFGSAGPIAAQNVLMAIVNRAEKGKSYVGLFQMANYTGHSDDLVFFFGLHGKSIETPEEKLMDAYFPSMVKQFLKTGQPDKDWKPTDYIGRGFFVLDFVVNPTNGSLINWPHFVPEGYAFPDEVDFWLREMPAIERNATLHHRNFDAKNSSFEFSPVPRRPNNHQMSQMHKMCNLSQSGTNPDNCDIDKHQDNPFELFSFITFNDTLNANETSLSNTESPEFYESIDEEDEEEPPSTTKITNEEDFIKKSAEQNLDNKTSAERNLQITEEGAEQNLINKRSQRSEGTMHPPPEKEVKKAPSLVEPTSKRVMSEEELPRVWTAFWLAISVATIFALIILIIVISRAFYRYKTGFRRGGYSFVGPAHDLEHYFTERSPINSINKAPPAATQLLRQQQQGMPPRSYSNILPLERKCVR